MPPQTKAFTRRRATLSISAISILAGVSLCASIGLFGGSLAAPAPDETLIAETATASSEANHKIAAAYGKLPLSFAANHGQANSRVRFIARGLGYNVFLTANEAVLALRSQTLDALEEGEPGLKSDLGDLKVVRMKLAGGNRKARVSAVHELPGTLNYFLGGDRTKWRRNVPTFAGVRYSHVYPGIDLVYHGNQQQLEYDFLIAPGASPRRIRMEFNGIQKTSIDAGGNLILSTESGDIRQEKPIAYQEFNGTRREVKVSYELDGNSVAFETGAYDKSLPLVIDPVLIYSTFLGGSAGEQGFGIAVDLQGNAYLTGITFSTDFPTVGAFQSVKDSLNDVFVVKLNPAGSALVYGTYLGGNGDDVPNAIANDAQGSAYVVGTTGSGSFPRTLGVFQDAKDGSVDGFLSKLSPDGSSLSYSTFLGGENIDNVFGVAVDTAGRAYVAGRTDSTHFRNFPFPTPRHGNPTLKSANSATNWSPSASGLTGSTVNSYAIDRNNSNIIYAGTNTGVFKSTDGGANWILTAGSVTTPFAVNAIAIDPTNSSTLYLAASTGVYKSTDGGLVYELKSSGFFFFTANAIAIDPTTPATVYAGTSANPWKSTNGGELVFDPTNTATIYMGSNRGMYKSTNGGTSWSTINNGALNSSFIQIAAVAIDPLNPSTLYAGAGATSNAMYKTTDGGGERWNQPTATS